MNAFSRHYKKLIEAEVSTWSPWLADIYKQELRNRNLGWLFVKSGTRQIAMALFDLGGLPKKIYISQVVIHPQFESRGIAEKGFALLREKYPSVEEFSYKTRNFNTPSIRLGEKLGFVPALDKFSKFYNHYYWNLDST